MDIRVKRPIGHGARLNIKVAGSSGDCLEQLLTGETGC